MQLNKKSIAAVLAAILAVLAVIQQLVSALPDAPTTAAQSTPDAGASQ